MNLELVTPKVERDVVITMTEAEAKALLEIHCSLGGSKVKNELDNCGQKENDVSWKFWRLLEQNLESK